MKLTIMVFATKDTDYPIPVYEATVEHEGGIWVEVFATHRELECFVKGLRACGGTDVLPWGSFREDWISGRLRDTPFQLWPEIKEED